MSLTYRRTVPILRSFDAGKTTAFYRDWLGFALDWEHRFAPDLPLYQQVSRDGIVLHLSEHHGDATPGSHVRIELDGLGPWHAELLAKRYANNRPGLETPPWGGIEMTVTDPAGNRITFAEPAA